MSANFQNLFSSLFFDYFSRRAAKKLCGCQRLCTKERINEFYCGDRKDLKIIWNHFSCPIYINAQLCYQYSFSSLCWQVDETIYKQTNLYCCVGCASEVLWVSINYHETQRVISFLPSCLQCQHIQRANILDLQVQ